MVYRRYYKTYKDENGYRRFSDSGKSVHRWVAAKKVGRPLNSRERVHHINRDKTDNRRSNLWVFGSQKQHYHAHKQDERRFGTDASFGGFKEKKKSFWGRLFG